MFFFSGKSFKMVHDQKEEDEHVVNGENVVVNGGKIMTNGENGIVNGNSHSFNYDEYEYLRLTRRILETGRC